MLAALIGLSQMTPPMVDAPSFSVPERGLPPELEHYPWARRQLLQRASDSLSLSLTALERGLYMLSQQLPTDPRRSWAAYGHAIVNALDDLSRGASGDDGAPS